MTAKTKLSHRILSAVLCVAMLVTCFPVVAMAAEASSVTTVADPETLTRPETIYGDNTVNAGKVTVGKSVSDKDVIVNGQKVTIDGENNFLVTISQSAQVMGLTSEINTPLDVVIVFDTSGSMSNDSNGNGKNRTEELVEAANKMIATLMEMNELNRVGVVAFSAHNAGGGTAGYNAANTLSELAHYTGEAATNHLTWTTGAGPSWAPTVRLVQGRSTTNRVNNSRYGTGGATNIQAGVTLGAQLLMEADTTVDINGQEITRNPIMILMSDGAPTVSAYENQWWNASQTNNQGPTNAPFMGNGFLTVLTASYYKNEITKHYYGENAGANACSFYTVGVELSDNATQDTREEVDLSYMTLNPTGEFVEGSDNYYYDRSNAQDSFLDAWNSYKAGEEFSVRVWSGQDRHDGYYYFYNTSHTIWNANDYKNGSDTWTTVGRTTVQANILDSVKTLHYNDAFYDVTDVSELTASLDTMLAEIARKAITVPTKVTGDHDFDGYVTFTDPIGEYMEVKDMKGVIADGFFYQGVSFAERISRYGTADSDKEFDELFVDVLRSRMHLTSSVVDIDDFASKVLASKNQAYYNGPDDYDNSIVWWGNAYDSGEEDEQVQVMGFADNDTIEYIEEQKAAGAIPEGADYVCRSYFFYGEAGGANPDPEHEYLYFMVRVQRELQAPYKETVVISAPASLLSMEKVLVTESFDENGKPVYKATVQHKAPARVVYEVGLWDTITPENVSYIVSPEYAGEKVNGAGSVNYDAATDTYSFFTNDWDRTQSLDSHHRPLAKATFDAAADNSFYTYQKDTLIVDANGNAVKSDPRGSTAYYVREYYEWNADNHEDGTYSAEKKSVLIKVDIPADAVLVENGGGWYIPKGTYTAATLIVNGDDTVKSENLTGTSSIVSHPHRTGNSENSHYTVFLGNNGRLDLVADPYEPVKSVSVNLPENAAKITDDDGKAVKVGDVLTYVIEVKNVLTEAATITVSDYVPVGTAFVEGSAGYGNEEVGHTKDDTVVPDKDNVLNWVLDNVPAGEKRYVSFSVTVTEAALSLSTVPGTIDNQAHVQLENTPAVSTNTTKNPPYDKTVTDTNNLDIDGDHGFKVGDTLVYHVRFHNNAKDDSGKYVAANVTVTDKIPAGTTFIAADNGGVFDADTGIVTWTIEDMAADSAKVVSFSVKINASAKIDADGVQPKDGEIFLPNTAIIRVENDPEIELTTNTTENWADVGDLVITKTVAKGTDTNKTFKLLIGESTGLLEGTYVLDRNGAEETVEFAEGKATVSIKHGDTLTVKGLPAGAIVSVSEDVSALPGWTPAYNTQSVTIVDDKAAEVSTVSVTNTYTLQPLTLTLKGIKSVKGTLPTETTFGFIAEPDSANPVAGDALTGEVTVKAEGEYRFDFSSKTFTQPGEYKYTVSEINGGVAGVEYEDASFTLVVNVKDNGDGTLSATATLDGEEFDFESDAVVFKNTYTPDDIPLTVVAKKTLKIYDAQSGSYKDASEIGAFRFQIVDKASGKVVTTGTSDPNGTITFNTFYFSADLLEGASEKTFTFVAGEIVPEVEKDPNMLYDLNGYEFEATLTLGKDGKLSVEVNGDSDGKVDISDSVEFVNYQNPASVEITPEGTKTTSDAPVGATFSFTVINTENGNEASAGVGDANGDISFSPLSFYEPGTYTYWIRESNAGNTTNGITYDLTRYLMKVTVERDSFNRLTAKVTYWASTVDGSESTSDYTTEVSAPAFHNEYNAGGFINITATKKLSGRDLVAGEFAFKLIRSDNGGEIDGIVDSTGKINFSTLYYSQADITPGNTSEIIEYTLSEVIPAAAKLPGVTYDESSYKVYVRITDNGDGTIAAELVRPENGGYTAIGSNDTGVVFNNSYATVNGDEIKFSVKKNLSGRDLRYGEFDFQLIYNGITVNVAKNDESGIVTFVHEIPAIVKPGTYKYTVKEAVGNLSGVKYDETTYELYVKITDDGKGNLVARLVDVNGVPLPEENGVVDLTDSIVFNNEYIPRALPIQLEAVKTLAGRELHNHEFSFVVRENNANGKIVASGSNDANGNILFSTFYITSADMAGESEKTFTYAILESDNNVPGVTVDKTVYTVTVKVTDDGKGALRADINYQSDGPIVFENIYKPGSVSLPLTAFKTLTGKKLLADEFTFELKDEDGNVKQSVKNGADGRVVFEPLTFTADDMTDGEGNKVMTKIFTYTVSELCEEADGMVYDTEVYTLTVTVTDDGNGNLNVSYTCEDKDGEVDLISFENSYTPSHIEIELEGTKIVTDTDGNVLSGENYPLSGFEFDVTDTEGKYITTATSDADGRILIDGLEFAAAGEYRFLISEKVTDREGYTTDPTVWCVHVTVGYNADTGVLYEANEYIHVAPESHDGIMAQASDELSFVNVYDPADVTLVLRVKKDLAGRDLREHEFTFCIVDKATGLTVAESRNHANGDVNFSLAYDKAGVYEYTVFELVPENDKKYGGIEFSEEEYNVTVNVTDDGKGALKAEVNSIIYTGSDTVDMTDSVIFHNKYEADPAEVTVEAVKHLDGKVLRADDFTFSLVNTENADEKYTAKNTADGKVRFDTITYTKAGVYVYELSEVEGIAGGMTYDKHVYTVTVTVTDDGNGKLHAVTEYESSDGGTAAVPAFYNFYESAPAEYIPEVKKLYEGGEMIPFSFILSGEGFETQEKQNDAEGTVIFDKLFFKNAGSYTFTVEEKIDESIEGIRWDTNVYTVVIEVTDNGEGQLEISDISVVSENGRNDLVFRNVNEDIITKKDVFLNGDFSASIDGMAVEKGDILTYTVTYKNFSGKTADVTITDTIPAYTEYVDGTADNGGVYDNGKLTWIVSGVAPDDSVTVSFNVKVTELGAAAVNHAEVLEGTNKFETNTVTTPIKEDTIEKDVFHDTEPEISIDGEKVQKDDVLLYKVTYTNSDDFAADVTITDEIPEYTSYVDGTADNGGVYEDGKITWNVSLAAGESITVAFCVKVVDTNITVVNRASAVEGGNKLDSNVVKNPVPEDKFEKDVFNVNEPTISIDGEKVQKGDVLLYMITYTNSFEAAADVTIIDTIPEYTAYVEGTADNGGVYEDGKITWNLSLAAGERKTVSFRVEIVGSNVTVENTAVAIEGENRYETNTVGTPVPEDKIEKDVFNAAEPQVSIDGETVKKGDTLLYKVTYTNSFEAAADVTITDEIPEYTTYVDGTADNGGVYEDGKITWNVSLAEGESITVSFSVKVVEADITVVNRASAVEGQNKIDSNEVENPVIDPTPDPDLTPDPDPDEIPEKDPTPDTDAGKDPESPQTGDDVDLWFILMMIGFGGFVGTAVFRAKRKESEEN